MPLPSLDQVAASSNHLAPAMLTAAAGSVLVLALSGLIVLAMRRASGSARYQVWLLGFAGVLILPLLSALLPGWRVLPVLVAQTNSPRPVAPVREVIANAPSAPTLPPQSISPPVTAKTQILIPDSAGSIHQPSPEITPIVPSEPNRAHVRNSMPLASTVRLPWTVWLVFGWASGTALILCRVLLGHLSLHALGRRCTKIDSGETLDSLERLRKELGLRRRVTLLTSPARTVPMTWGIWHARLLLPAQSAEWPAAQRRDVLLHELAHVKRRDCLTQFISQLACALYWFNPLAWIASRRMQVERERACDDLVLSRGTEPASYARHLLQSVSSVPWSRLVGPAVAMATPSTLEERMRAILDPRVNRRALTARGVLATVLLLSSSLLPMAALKAQQALPDNRVSAPPTTRPGAFGGGRFGARGGGFGGFGGAAPTLGEGPTCTFDATIYDVRVPVDQIGRLDVDALAKAADSVDAFEKSLSALGTVKPMYRAHQSVRLAGDTIMISSQVPIVTSNSMTATGHTVSSYSYQNLGAHFTLAGKTDGPRASQLDLNIQLSSASDTGTTVADNVKAPVIRTATMSHKGSFQAQRPFVVVSVDADSPDKDGKAVAYIARIIVGEPDAGAAK